MGVKIACLDEVTNQGQGVTLEMVIVKVHVRLCKAKPKMWCSTKDHPLGWKIIVATMQVWRINNNQHWPWIMNDNQCHLWRMTKGNTSIKLTSFRGSFQDGLLLMWS